MIKLILFVVAMTYGTIRDFSNCQIVKTTFFIKNIGVYANLDVNQSKVKVHIKRNEYYYFSLKNDSTALLQMVKGKKIYDAKEFRISSTYDSVFIKRYSSANNKVAKVEKVLFRSVY